MRLQKLQSYKLPLNPDKQSFFACNSSVTFVTFETFSKCVTAKVTRNSLIINERNFVTFVPVFFISSEIIFAELFLGDFDDFSDSWARI